MTSMAGRVPRSRGSRCLRGTLTTEGKVLLRRNAQPSRCIPSSAARMLSPISVPLANHLHFPCLSPGFVSHSAGRGWSTCPCTPLPVPRRPAQGQDKVDKSVCYAETTESCAAMCEDLSEHHARAVKPLKLKFQATFWFLFWDQ